MLNIETPEIPANLVAEELPGRLLDLWPKFLSYVISFLVILTYWIAHHSIFSAIKGYDRKLIWLNSLFLMCVAFLPFPASLFGEYGDQPLVDRDLDASMIKAYRLRGLAISLIFLLSIVISFFSVSAAVYSWVLLIVVDFVLFRVLRRYRWLPEKG